VRLFDRTNGETCILRTGDMTAYFRQTVLGDGISVFQHVHNPAGAGYTHIGWVRVKADGTVTVVEALEGGPVERDLVTSIGTDRFVMVRRRADRDFTEAEQAVMTEMALKMAAPGGTHYAFWHIAEDAVWSFTGAPGECYDGDLTVVPAVVDCAEEYVRLARLVGFDPIPGIAAKAASPAMLVETDLMTTIAYQLAVEP
jgi:hypothetical protein